MTLGDDHMTIKDVRLPIGADAQVENKPEIHWRGGHTGILLYLDAENVNLNRFRCCYSMEIADIKEGRKNQRIRISQLKDVEHSIDSSSSEGAGRPPTGEEFTQLLASNQDVLLWFVRSLLPGSPDVDDILQETNLTLWKKRASFEMGTSFLSWAKTVARWEVRAWLTRNKRHSWLVINDELTDAIADAIEMQVHGVGASARLDALHECLEKLRPRDRLLVSFYYQLGKSLDECAEIFRLSAKSMKSTVSRIRAALRRCIDARIALLKATR